MKVLIATNNPHKIEEFREIFADLPLELTFPRDEGLDFEPEETGTTFEENAIIKATAFAQVSGLLTIADDSGLEVDALGGEPGVYSARYGNTPKDAHRQRYELVLEKLRDVPDEKRTARFRCALAIVLPRMVIDVVEGTVEGRITRAPAGDGGFGYDPIFWVPEYGKTLAQVSAAEKHRISHRGRAARAAIPILKKLADEG